MVSSRFSLFRQPIEWLLSPTETGHGGEGAGSILQAVAGPSSSAKPSWVRVELKEVLKVVKMVQKMYDCQHFAPKISMELFSCLLKPEDQRKFCQV